MENNFNNASKMDVLKDLLFGQEMNGVEQQIAQLKGELEATRNELTHLIAANKDEAAKNQKAIIKDYSHAQNELKSYVDSQLAESNHSTQAILNEIGHLLIALGHKMTEKEAKQ